MKAALGAKWSSENKSAPWMRDDWDGDNVKWEQEGGEEAEGRAYDYWWALLFTLNS